MLKHIVMWRLSDFAEGKSKEENALIIKQLLEELPSKIDVIRHLEVGINVLKSDASYDAVLVTKFDSQEDLDAYQIHPDHKKVSNFVSKVREERAVVDYLIYD